MEILELRTIKVETAADMSSLEEEPMVLRIQMRGFSARRSERKRMEKSKEASESRETTPCMSVDAWWDCKGKREWNRKKNLGETVAENLSTWWKMLVYTTGRQINSFRKKNDTKLMTQHSTLENQETEQTKLKSGNATATVKVEQTQMTKTDQGGQTSRSRRDKLS